MISFRTVLGWFTSRTTPVPPSSARRVMNHRKGGGYRKGPAKKFIADYAADALKSIGKPASVVEVLAELHAAGATHISENSLRTSLYRAAGRIDSAIRRVGHHQYVFVARGAERA
jgi:hypothetical protein